jgi:transmembrane sensor
MTAPRDPSIPGELDRALDARPDGDALRAVWQALPDASRSVAADPAADAQRAAAWARLRARLDDPARVPSPDDAAEGIALVRGAAPRVTPAPVRRGLPRWIAAAALLLLVAGAGVWRAGPEQLTVDAGATPRHFLLADGSRLVLAPGSSAHLARGFRGVLGSATPVRSVRLEGEAFFTVARDGRPFVVETDDATIRVLGTRFDVRTAPGTGGTRVLVESGRVSVAARHDGADAIELGAGDGTVVQGNSPLRLMALPVARLTSWRAGGLAALDEPLGAVLEEMQRRFGVRIALEGGVATAARVSLFYPSVPAVESVLADLCTMQGLTYRRTSDGYVIAPGPARP